MVLYYIKSFIYIYLYFIIYLFIYLFILKCYCFLAETEVHHIETTCKVVLGPYRFLKSLSVFGIFSFFFQKSVRIRFFKILRYRLGFSVLNDDSVDNTVNTINTKYYE